MRKKTSETATVTPPDLSQATISPDPQMAACLKLIQGAQNDEVKAGLEELHGQIAKLLQSFNINDPDEVKADLETFVKEALKPAPRRDWLLVSSKGVITAARSVGVIAVPIIETMRKLMFLLRS